MRRDRRTAEDRLDKLCRFLVFLRDSDRYGPLCQICQSRHLLQWTHFYVRKDHSVKWDPDNSCVTCDDCHRRLHREHSELVDLFYNRLGGARYTALTRKSNRAAPLSVFHLEGIEYALHKEIQRIKHERKEIYGEAVPPPLVRSGVPRIPPGLRKNGEPGRKYVGTFQGVQMVPEGGARADGAAADGDKDPDRNSRKTS